MPLPASFIRNMATSNKRAFLFTIPLIINIAALSWLGWQGYQTYTVTTSAEQKINRIDNIRDQIVKLDEILTMSAMMGSVTQDPQWEERYKHYDPQLAENISEGINIVSNRISKHSLKELDEVNAALVSMEQQAMALGRQGRNKEAYGIMTSGRYWQLKNAYSENVKSLVSELETLKASTEKGIIDEVMAIIITVLLAIGSTFLSWLFIFRILNQWQMRLEESAKKLLEMNLMLDQKVAEQTAELRLANQKLLESNQDLENFAAVASHDLQEPLRKIMAFGTQLKTECSESISEEGLYYLERINNASERMRNLINDLLTYSRVIRKGAPFESVDLNETVNGVLQDLEVRIQEKGARITVSDLAPLDADPTQIRQLFQNLIGNALKFNQVGKTPEVRITGKQQDDPGLYEITVSDNGIGFDEKYLEKIFAIFQRLHGRQEYEGSGIGLAICRRIVSRHNGMLTANSKPGEGAVFRITLPIKQTSTVSVEHINLYTAEENKENTHVQSVA